MSSPEIEAAASAYLEAFREFEMHWELTGFQEPCAGTLHDPGTDTFELSIKLTSSADEKLMRHLDAILVTDGWTLVHDKRLFSNGKRSIDNLIKWLGNAQAPTPQASLALENTWKKIRKLLPIVRKLASESWLTSGEKSLCIEEKISLRTAFRHQIPLLEASRNELANTIPPLFISSATPPVAPIIPFTSEDPFMPVRLFLGGKLRGLAQRISTGLGPAGLTDDASDIKEISRHMLAFHTEGLWQYFSVYPENEDLQDDLRKAVNEVRVLLINYLKVLLTDDKRTSKPGKTNTFPAGIKGQKTTLKLRARSKTPARGTSSRPRPGFQSAEKEAPVFQKEPEIGVSSTSGAAISPDAAQEPAPGMITIQVKQHESGPRFLLNQYEIKTGQRNSLYWLLKTFHDRRATTPPFRFTNCEFAELWVNRRNPNPPLKCPKSPSKYVGFGLRLVKLPKHWNYPGDQLHFKKKVDKHDDTVFRIVNLQFEELPQP